jgi:hypothetical protein
MIGDTSHPSAGDRLHHARGADAVAGGDLIGAAVHGHATGGVFDGDLHHALLLAVREPVDLAA